MCHHTASLSFTESEDEELYKEAYQVENLMLMIDVKDTTEQIENL
jgi:hypothetical protein